MKLSRTPDIDTRAVRLAAKPIRSSRGGTYGARLVPVPVSCSGGLSRRLLIICPSGGGNQPRAPRASCRARRTDNLRGGERERQPARAASAGASVVPPVPPPAPRVSLRQLRRPPERHETRKPIHALLRRCREWGVLPRLHLQLAVCPLRTGVEWAGRTRMAPSRTGKLSECGPLGSQGCHFVRVSSPIRTSPCADISPAR